MVNLHQNKTVTLLFTALVTTLAFLLIVFLLPDFKKYKAKIISENTNFLCRFGEMYPSFEKSTIKSVFNLEVDNQL